LAFNNEVLKDWRVKKKLSQTEAAKLFGITQAFYSHLEIGIKTPSLGTLEIISGRTGIPVSDLLDSLNPIPPRTRRPGKIEEKVQA
jgi:transcriptional regulator with XRE-family HTH domain